MLVFYDLLRFRIMIVMTHDWVWFSDPSTSSRILKSSKQYCLILFKCTESSMFIDFPSKRPACFSHFSRTTLRLTRLPLLRLCQFVDQKDPGALRTADGLHDPGRSCSWSPRCHMDWSVTVSYRKQKTRSTLVGWWEKIWKNGGTSQTCDGDWQQIFEGSNHFLSPPQIFCWMFSVKKAISSEHQEHRLTHIETISINMVGLPDFTMKHHTTLPYLVPLQHLQLASISP